MKMGQDKMIDLLWRLGIGPRMAGFRYIIRSVEAASSGVDITPDLLHLVADEFGVSFPYVYSAMKKAKEHAMGYRMEEYKHIMRGYGDTLYDFLYALSRQI